ncbi:MAG TPA: ATP-binding protein [Acidobacteriaceae bacterium]|nr:ATP-binding protein [Acidobacteriaceae bacterium]
MAIAVDLLGSAAVNLVRDLRWFAFSSRVLLVGGLMLVAMIVGHLTSRASFFLNRAQKSTTEAERLYQLTRETTQLDPHRKPGPQLAALVRSIFDVEAVAIFDADLNEVYRAGEWFPNMEDRVRNIYFFETVHDDPETGLIRRVLRMGNLPIGALLLRGSISSLTSNAIALLIGITFDRYHAFANESRTESARQAEQLRTTVLDSLAHAYKTPLTAIRAASTGLGEMGSLTPAQAGLVALIDEQSGLLNTLTNRLLKTARLDAHDLTLHSESVAVAPLIDDVVASVREHLTGISVKVALAREDLSVPGDRSLLVALLTQFVDNAGKYATAGTTVTIEAAEQPNAVIFSVHNLGPVIPAADYERVFDRYFRSSSSARKAPGTGVGLSVAKRAAQAHGGHVWVTSDCNHGTTFFASLPISAQGVHSS